MNVQFRTRGYFIITFATIFIGSNIHRLITDFSIVPIFLLILWLYILFDELSIGLFIEKDTLINQSGLFLSEYVKISTIHTVHIKKNDDVQVFPFITIKRDVIYLINDGNNEILKITKKFIHNKEQENEFIKALRKSNPNIAISRGV